MEDSWLARELRRAFKLGYTLGGGTQEADVDALFDAAVAGANLGQRKVRRTKGSPNEEIGTFRVQSSTAPLDEWQVTLGKQDAFCNCPGFIHRGRCSHIDAARSKIAEEILAADRIKQMQEDFS